MTPCLNRSALRYVSFHNISIAIKTITTANARSLVSHILAHTLATGPDKNSKLIHMDEQ